MKRTEIIKVRANEFEKEILKLITDKANADIQTLTESDIVRLAIMDFAKKHLSHTDLEEVKNKYSN